MFQVGELVLYGTTGVCEVIRIAPHDLSGKGSERLYYFLKPLYQQCVISTPVDSDKVFLRPIISREEAERLIDLIPTVQGRTYPGTALRELTAQYEQAIASHNCMDLVELIVSIYHKKQALLRKKRRVGSVDERFMKRAEELLYGELGAALGIERDAVHDYIARRIQATRQNAAEPAT